DRLRAAPRRDPRLRRTRRRGPHRTLRRPAGSAAGARRAAGAQRPPHPHPFAARRRRPGADLPNGIVRRTSRRVTRYRDANMALRWTAAGFLEAEKSFRKIQGVKDLWILKTALGRPTKQAHVDEPMKAA